MNTKKLIYSALITPDGTELNSRFRHDYLTYTDSITGEEYMLDGGLDYIRTSKNEVPGTYISIYTDDAHEVIRDYFTWGTYGKNGGEKLHYITLDSMTDGHVQAIVDNVTHLPDHIMKLFKDELEYRSGH